MIRYVCGLLALFLLTAAAPHPRPNWDHIWWGMSFEEFARSYPSAENEEGEVWLPATRVARSAPLANLIEPGSNVRFYFSRGSTQLWEIDFVSAHTYDQIMPLMQRTLGHQATGEDTEANCFAADGSRRSWDPSGVGHVLEICLGDATFLDRAHGNFIEVTGAGGQPDRFRPTPSDAPYQYITMRSVEGY